MTFECVQSYKEEVMLALKGLSDAASFEKKMTEYLHSETHQDEGESISVEQGKVFEEIEQFLVNSNSCLNLLSSLRLVSNSEMLPERGRDVAFNEVLKLEQRKLTGMATQRDLMWRSLNCIEKRLLNNIDLESPVSEFVEGIAFIDKLLHIMVNFPLKDENLSSQMQTYSISLQKVRIILEAQREQIIEMRKIIPPVIPMPLPEPTSVPSPRSSSRTNSCGAAMNLQLSTSPKKKTSEPNEINFASVICDDSAEKKRLENLLNEAELFFNSYLTMIDLISCSKNELLPLKDSFQTSGTPLGLSQRGNSTSSAMQHGIRMDSKIRKQIRFLKDLLDSVSVLVRYQISELDVFSATMPFMDELDELVSFRGIIEENQLNLKEVASAYEKCRLCSFDLPSYFRQVTASEQLLGCVPRLLSVIDEVILTYTECFTPDLNSYLVHLEECIAAMEQNPRSSMLLENFFYNLLCFLVTKEFMHIKVPFFTEKIELAFEQITAPGSEKKHCFIALYNERNEIEQDIATIHPIVDRFQAKEESSVAIQTGNQRISRTLRKLGFLSQRIKEYHSIFFRSGKVLPNYDDFKGLLETIYDLVFRGGSNDAEGNIPLLKQLADLIVRLEDGNSALENDFHDISEAPKFVSALYRMNEVAENLADLFKRLSEKVEYVNFYSLMQVLSVIAEYFLVKKEPIVLLKDTTGQVLFISQLLKYYPSEHANDEDFDEIKETTVQSKAIVLKMNSIEQIREDLLRNSYFGGSVLVATQQLLDSLMEYDTPQFLDADEQEIVMYQSAASFQQPGEVMVEMRFNLSEMPFKEVNFEISDLESQEIIYTGEMTSESNSLKIRIPTLAPFCLLNMRIFKNFSENAEMNAEYMNNKNKISLNLSTEGRVQEERVQRFSRFEHEQPLLVKSWLVNKYNLLDYGVAFTKQESCLVMVTSPLGLPELKYSVYSNEVNIGLPAYSKDKKHVQLQLEDINIESLRCTRKQRTDIIAFSSQVEKVAIGKVAISEQEMLNIKISILSLKDLENLRENPPSFKIIQNPVEQKQIEGPTNKNATLEFTLQVEQIKEEGIKLPLTFTWNLLQFASSTTVSFSSSLFSIKNSLII